MTIPIWSLFGFALWTLVLLFGSVGIYRWSRILTGRQEARTFLSDAIDGEDWYKRAMRAHANCIENLPLFGVLVFILYVMGLSGPIIDALCASVLSARILQSLVHVCLRQSNLVVYIRFFFYFSQALCFFWLSGLVLMNALP